MNVSSVDQGYVFSGAGRQIYARPLGNVAAAMIGVAALAALELALVLGDKPARTPVEAEIPQSEAFVPPQGGDALARSPLAFELGAPEFAKEKKSVASRDIEGGREDSLTFGQFAGAGPYLRFGVRQITGERRAIPDFFLDLTRHAAGAGLSAFKIGQPAPLATRFGAFEAADIRLTPAAPEAGAAERACTAFRLAGAKGPVEMVGLACGPGAKPLERRALGCLIDRLELAPGAGNAALEQLFQSVDVDRAKACAAASPGATDKTSWIETHSRTPESKSDALLPPKHAKKAR
jgi:hypothetical protein